MLQHVLGVGAIGSLLAVQLSRNTANVVRLIVRDSNLFRESLSAAAEQEQQEQHAHPRAASSTSAGSSSSSSTYAARSIAIERKGVQQTSVNLEAELLPVYTSPSNHPRASEKKHEEARQRLAKFQSFGPITSLFVTTKAPQVLPALRALLPRLSRQSTIVLLQNGAGLLDSLNAELFTDEEMRPNFIVGINTHGANVKRIGGAGRSTPSDGAPSSSSLSSSSMTHQQNDRPAGIVTEWAGVGEIAFGIVPNVHVQDLLERKGSTMRGSEMQESHAPTITPRLSDIPIDEDSRSLIETVSSLLSCKALNPRWLPFDELQLIQLQKVVVNAVINSLTAIYDVTNGMILSSRAAQVIAHKVCIEATSVFAQHLRGTDTEADGPTHFPTDHPLHLNNLYERVVAVARATGDNISSTLQDVRGGRPSTEIPYMNGYISTLGQRYGIPTPTNDTLTQLVACKVDMSRTAMRLGATRQPVSLKPISASRTFGLQYKPLGKGDVLQRTAIRAIARGRKPSGARQSKPKDRASKV